jgi:isoleucyl-tRNA synthetase
MPEKTRPDSYPEVPATPNYPAMEEATLAYWQSDGTFAASVAQRDIANEYVFYDGPPFANGMPHYGHLLTGFVKDALPRYQTMRGRRVERRFGWDCHGLPAETEAQRELGVSGRTQITAYGIDRFNEHCKTSVLRYTAAWERYVTRQGRWVDFENDYKTMDLSYMESVIWAFKTLYERGLIYEGQRVLPYCWECETPLSNFETRQDDAYRDRVDPAVTVVFSLDAAPEDSGPAAGPLHALTWTTTPWTLPSNLALAVGPEINYTVYERHGRRYLVGESRAQVYADLLDGATLVGTVAGAELVGRTYHPLFGYFAGEANAFRVLAADFVTTEEGTGIVHIAPGFGEDDQRLCEENGIAVVCPVDGRGRFDDRVPDLAGLQVFEANERIIDNLAKSGTLVRREEYVHSYPHCWRSETPLIYRAVSSFFVRVSAIKDRMVELNRQIHWVPEHVGRGAFGKWLEGARDWSITRNRFWGAPIPVWKSDDPAWPRVDVYGSLDELAADFGVRPDDLHRPGIDALTRPNPDDPTGRSTMRRVEDVLDCWFESGSMPFAQLHYPFENAARFEEHFPADLICEYVGQTRGWFYTMHVLATALFDRPAFSHCIAHGVLLGNDGRKLSKHLKNFPDPEEFFASDGSDTMRWYLLSSPVLRGLDAVIEETAMSEPLRVVMNPIWNSWHFLALYGRSDGVVGRVRTDQTGLLDRYVLAKTRHFLEQVTEAFDTYDLPGAAGMYSGFLDALTNWYIRRSRDRFWRPFTGDPAADADKTDAYDTLHTVLYVLARVAAPLLPFLAEEVFRGLTSARSVHLTSWPDPEELVADPELVESMDLVREVCSAIHSVRKARGLRARLPLPKVIVAHRDASRLEPFSALIANEANVKAVELEPEPETLATSALSVLPAEIGPRLGPTTQQVIAAVRRGDWQPNGDGRIAVAGAVLEPGEFHLRLMPRDPGSGRVIDDDRGVVVLDTQPTPELEAEGTARDLVRIVQQARRDADLVISDQISLALVVPPDVGAVLDVWGEELRHQTLATSLSVIAPDDPRGATLAGRVGVAHAVHELPDGRAVEVYLAPSPQRD